MLKKTSILGVGITNEKEDRILEYLLLSLNNHITKYYIVTPNPEILVYAYNHSSYRKILNEARIALPDGAGVFLGSALIGNPLKERITGVDFMGEVCERSRNQLVKVGFLGGRHGVAEKTAECLMSKYPWLNVVFVAEEWSEAGFIKQPVSGIKYKVSSMENKKSKGILNTKYLIHNTDIDILFVGFGHPKQEEWIYKNLNRLPVKIAMGVGGAFDYISGQIDRAPFMIRAIGFEWLYRLIREPWRWRRQLALPKFVWLVIKEKFGRL